MGLLKTRGDSLQVIVNLVQRTFSSLRDRYTVVGITLRLVQTGDLSSHTVGDGLASSVVFGAVDAQAEGQALHGGLHSGLALAQVVLTNQRSNVGVDD